MSREGRRTMEKVLENTVHDNGTELWEDGKTECVTEGKRCSLNLCVVPSLKRARAFQFGEEGKRRERLWTNGYDLVDYKLKSSYSLYMLLYRREQ